jgi:transketolase
LLDLLMPVIPELIGGSADLTSSNNTRPKSADVIARDSFSGRYIHFGVREHGMAAAMTGLALHGGLIPYGGTFLTFSDYCRPSIRLAALMRQRVIFVMTHDSIGLGEDGPTHQPVEHLAALRAIPNLLVFRPADAVETAECWQIALRTIDRPSVIVLTRQGVETVRIVHFGDNLSARGGYVLAAADGPARVTLIATGSEVGVALAARTMLKADGVGASVVSMPCWELFEQQRASYRRSTIDQTTLRVGIEAAVSHGWDRYLGPDGVFVGMPGFGESAPAGDLYEHFGITAERVVAEVRAKLL